MEGNTAGSTGGSTGRVAQVFVWKQGAAPDIDYARQILRVVNPDAYSAVSTANPPLQLFSIMGQWPEEPWPRVLQDMRAIPTPNGARWTDTTRYELRGWQGSDRRTADKLFVVIVAERADAVSSDTFRGTNVEPPPNMPRDVPQYYPPQYGQYSQQGQAGPPGWPQQSQPYGGYSPYPSLPPGAIYGQPTSYPYGYVTGPLQVIPAPMEPARPVVPHDFGQYYSGFGVRLAAVLIDFFFFCVLLLVTGAIVVLANGLLNYPQPNDSNGWLALLGPFICLDLIIAIVYHVIGWNLYGQTFGKNLMGIKIVRTDGTRLLFGHAALRMLGYFISLVFLGLGFLMIAVDSRRQGLHDKMAETFVVPEKPPKPTPPGLQGYKPPPELPPAQDNTAYRLAPVPTSGETTRLPERASTPTGESWLGSKQAAAIQAAQTLNGAQSTEANRATEDEDSETYVTPNPPSGPLTPVPDALSVQAQRDWPERASDTEKARALFKSGIAELERGVRRGHGLMDIEPTVARSAAERFSEALKLVPTAVAYRYFYAVALRYSEGYEVASSEFSQVLEFDPGNFEAQRQGAFGPRWHDAFAYPAWGDAMLAVPGESLPEPIASMLAQPRRPGTRLVLLRDGTNKMVVALSRTRRDSWARLPTEDMPAHIQMHLSRTPSGPIIAFYVVVQDDPDNPFKGETFLNPHDLGQPSDDACQLGQHVLEQLAQQDHTYLIFVDENDRLLLSRKLAFGAATQVNIARILYEVQNLPQQAIDPARFQQAAQWHMEHFALDKIT